MILADVLLPSFYLTAGLAALFPSFLFAVFSESYVISKLLHLPFGRSFRLSIGANIVSGIIGGCLFFFVPINLSGNADRNDLYAYVHQFFAASLIAYGVYYAFSVFIEWLYGIDWKRKNQPNILKTDLLKSFIAANIVSYVVLVPIHYYFHSPGHQVHSVTQDTAWAIQPPADVLYLDKDTQNLWTVKTDGSGNRPLVPHPMKQYLVSADLEQVVFFSEGKQLFHYNTANGVLRKLWESERYSFSSAIYGNWGEINSIEYIAISPSGTKVAWVLPVKDGSGGPNGHWETDFWKLSVYDLTTEKKLCLDYRAKGSVIAWSRNEEAIYIRCLPIQDSNVPGIQGIAKFVISKDRIEIESSIDGNSLDFFETYGRFGRRETSGGKITIHRNTDSCGTLNVSTPFIFHLSIGSYITITRGDESVFSFSNTPFYAPLSEGLIHEPSFVQEGKECLFESEPDIYLIDIAGRKVGKLIEGKDYIVLTQSYQQGFNFMKKR